MLIDWDADSKLRSDLMGVNVYSHKMIMDSAAELIDNFLLSFILIGNQYMRPKVREEHRLAHRHYKGIKDVFGHVVAVDNNGAADDVLTKDMGVEQKDLFGTFDLLFNGGTLEHVENQREAWRNCHYFLKEGGIAIHVCPLKDGWSGHSYFLYTENFFEELIKANKYEVTIEPKIVMHKIGQAIYIAFRKAKAGAFQWKPCESEVWVSPLKPE